MRMFAFFVCIIVLNLICLILLNMIPVGRKRMTKKRDHLLDHNNPKNYLPENTKSFKAENIQYQKGSGICGFLSNRIGTA